MEPKNASIRKVSIEFNHGHLTAWVHLDFGGGGQGFGGYGLGGPHCAVFLKRCMNVIGVDKWQDLEGKPCRIRNTQNRVHEIGHFIKDDWFNPENEFKAMETNND